MGHTSILYDPPVCRPLVGIGTLVTRENGNFLLGKRKNGHCPGYWACPGGHLEFGEDFATAAKRETKEETNLDLHHLMQYGVANNYIPYENVHYVSIYMAAAPCDAKTLRNLEPDKCEEWHWVSWDNLPAPLFYTFDAFFTHPSILIPYWTWFKEVYKKAPYIPSFLTKK